MRIGYAAAVGAMVLATACGGDRGASAERVAASPGTGAASADTVVVYKTPTCGCCNAWVDHVRENGFAVVTHDMSDADLAVRKGDLGVPAGRISCHTATVRGYVVEGHVPADLIRRMIDERAAIRGLAVPGMPMGSPGMEGLIKQDYEVLAFDSTGATTVYARR